MIASLLWLARIGLWLLLIAAAAHLARLAAWAWTRRPAALAAARPAAPLPADAPPVTVQLPMRNELAVAERTLRAACALRWPRDRLEVQVLDDSDDETSALIDRVAADLVAAGHDVRVVRRVGRAHWKAGNLANGLTSARGEFIAVLDADAVPEPDFLARLIPPLLADPSLGFAQGRWIFDNERASLLTRVQALILHGLMLVEQPWLCERGLPLSFNGSGGVWRRAAIDAAGGWLGLAADAAADAATDAASRSDAPVRSAASITEDVDLAYRARAAGYRGLHVPDVEVATELPSTMTAFRAQQKRWVKGGAQVLRALNARAAGADPVGAGARSVMLAHLARHLRQPYLAPAVLWLAVPLLDRPSAWAASSPHEHWIWLACLAAFHLAAGAYYGAAFHRMGRSPIEAAVISLLLAPLSMGLAIALTIALIEGLFQSPARARFERTPKQGAAATTRYVSPRDPLSLLELAAGVVWTVLALWILANGRPAAALAAGYYLAAGLLWVGGLTSARR